MLKDSTRSLCPICFREIEARIIEESAGIFMEKECPEHGSLRSLVEKDAAVYKALMNDGSKKRPLRSLVIPVTHRCNLRCRMCFLPEDGVSDPPQKAIFRIIDRFEGNVAFSGGEPTLRKDLPELVAYARSRGKRTCVVTNGLSFSDRSLVDRLSGAGLNNCLFSMNGLSDDVFQEIEGQPLYDLKMKALENLRHSGIRPLLSTTVASGINEKELKDLADFYEENPALFYGWRIRAQAPIGRHTDTSALFLSDLINLTCGALGIDRNDLLARVAKDDLYHGTTHMYFDAFCTNDNGRKTDAIRTAVRRTRCASSGGFRPGIRELYRMNTPSGCSMTQRFRLLFYRMFHSSKLRIFRINLFAWPKADNIDLAEIEQTGIYHTGPKGESMPFVKALLLNQGKPDWNWL